MTGLRAFEAYTERCENDNPQDAALHRSLWRSTAQARALIEEAIATVDDGKRAAILAKATELAINDLAIIPLHYQVNTWATRKEAGLKYLARTDEATILSSLKKQ